MTGATLLAGGCTDAETETVLLVAGVPVPEALEAVMTQATLLPESADTSVYVFEVAPAILEPSRVH